ncbi:MAG: hypothetical protein AB7S38_21690 [Vulcanimicrobiota bacterium]
MKDDALRRLQELAERLQDPDNPVDEHNLDEVMGELSASLTDVFAFANQHIQMGLRQVETARQALAREGLEEADEVAGLLKDLGAARRQLDVSLDLTRENLEGAELGPDPVDGGLLTPPMRECLRRLDG